MSTQPNDGGPAFPSPPAGFSKGYDPHRDGMTLRDWFAGQALTGWIAGTRDAEAVDWDASWWAREAYRTADAMLAERAKGDGAP